MQEPGSRGSGGGGGEPALESSVYSRGSRRGMRATGWLVLCLTVFAWFTSRAATPPAPSAAPAQPIGFGEKFPGGTFENVNSGVGGPPSINLGEVVGRKPVVFCMWSVGHHRSEQVF